MSETAIQTAKKLLRQRIRGQLQLLSEQHRAGHSVQALDRLALQSLWRRAGSVLFYAPMPGELDIWPLLASGFAAGKQVALPRFDADAKYYVACAICNPATDLKIGQFGIREPTEACVQIPLNRLDLILVPGVGFDLQGRRLGRGRGFYDRMLAAARGTTCGVAFDEQIVEEIPTGPHDISVNCILTPTRWIEL